jgi:adenylate kinase family enzyme
MAARFRRVLVIGISGAGKTTLATRLAAATGLPLIHLDREHWLPEWQEPPKAEWRAKVRSLVAADEWVIDGNFAGTFDLRMPRADAIVWLDYPSPRCLVRVLRRVATNWGTTRSDMGEGCPERLDWRFLLYVWRFQSVHRPVLERAIATFAREARVFRITADRQWQPLIAELAAA